MVTGRDGTSTLLGLVGAFVATALLFPKLGWLAIAIAPPSGLLVGFVAGYLLNDLLDLLFGALATWILRLRLWPTFGAYWRRTNPVSLSDTAPSSSRQEWEGKIVLLDNNLVYLDLGLGLPARVPSSMINGDSLSVDKPVSVHITGVAKDHFLEAEATTPPPIRPPSH